jgi:CubicO group peptidase (beta-lactamase class C family)
MFNIRRVWKATISLAIALLPVDCRAGVADEVDDYITAAMARQHIPGLSLAITRNGNVIKVQGYGLASVELNVSATSETAYELASATKPFLAVAVMQLVQEGKLSLDDSVSKAYPEGIPDPRNYVIIARDLNRRTEEGEPVNLARERILIRWGVLAGQRQIGLR